MNSDPVMTDGPAADEPIRTQPVRYRSNILKLLLFVVPLQVVLMVPIQLTGQTGFRSMLALGMVIVGGMILALNVQALWTRRRLKQLNHDACQPSDELGEIMSVAGGASQSMHALSPRFNSLVALARHLYQHGERGRIWRLHDPSETPVAPAAFEQPFEPTPLYERSESLQQLTGKSVETTQHVQRAWREFTSVFGRSVFARFGGVLLALLVIFGFSMLFRDSFRDLTSGQVPEILEIGAMVGIFFVLTWMWKSSRPTQWLVVPGAIVIRSSLWSRSTWDVNVLSREQCVLLYWEQGRQLAIAGPEGVAISRMVTPVEAEAAMQAFLSPLPPPRVEALSDLT